MSSEAEKKERERFYLDQFLRFQGFAPQEIRALSVDSAPDFLINLGGHHISIELTALSLGGTLLALESYGDKVLAKARQSYVRDGNPSVLVSLAYTTRFRKNIRRDQLADLIAKKVQLMSHDPTEAVDWKSIHDEVADPVLSEYVAHIHVRRVPEDRFARWAVARAGWSTELLPTRIQSEIDRKANKIERYKRFATEVWLLIHSDRKNPSQMFSERSGNQLIGISGHPFTRVFYLLYPSGVFEIPHVEAP